MEQMEPLGAAEYNKDMTNDFIKLFICLFYYVLAGFCAF